MAITDRDRKILWSKGGFCCAMCRTSLVREGEAGAGLAVIGDECHIVSPAGTGPRAGQPVDDLDGYDNLILLCPNDHRLIDSLIDAYPVEHVREIKRSHEEWVRTSLAESEGLPVVSIVRSRPAALRRLWTGREVINVAANTHEWSLDHEDLRNEEELDLVAGFIQTVHDWAEIWCDVEPADRVRATFDLDRDVKNLQEHGWLVFGERTRGKLRGGVSDGESAWDTAYFRLVRSDSPTIIRLDWTEEGDAAGEASS